MKSLETGCFACILLTGVRRRREWRCRATLESVNDLCQRTIDRSRQEGVRFRALLADGESLVAQAQQTWREIDQVWAARKDARAKGRKRCHEQAVERGFECHDPVQQQPCLVLPTRSVPDVRR